VTDDPVEASDGADELPLVVPPELSPLELELVVVSIVELSAPPVEDAPVLCANAGSNGMITMSRVRKKAARLKAALRE